MRARWTVAVARRLSSPARAVPRSAVADCSLRDAPQPPRVNASSSQMPAGSAPGDIMPQSIAEKNKSRPARLRNGSMQWKRRGTCPPGSAGFEARTSTSIARALHSHATTRAGAVRHALADRSWRCRIGVWQRAPWRFMTPLAVRAGRRCCRDGRGSSASTPSPRQPRLPLRAVGSWVLHLCALPVCRDWRHGLPCGFSHQRRI